MSDRRGFLKGILSAPVAAVGAAHVAEEAIIEEMFAGGRRHAYGISGDIITGGDTVADGQRWIADSAEALKAIAKLGGSVKAPPELTMNLAPWDRAKLVNIDKRARKLSRLKSMSEAARDAYIADEAA